MAVRAKGRRGVARRKRRARRYKGGTIGGWLGATAAGGLALWSLVQVVLGATIADVGWLLLLSVGLLAWARGSA